MEPASQFNAHKDDGKYTVRIKGKAALFGVNKKVAANKVSFAFLLDRFKPKNKADTQRFYQLKKYEWFAGSLALNFLRQNIGQFLQSEQANKLSPRLRDHLVNYVKMLGEAQEHYSRIDNLLARDVGFCLLVATGDPFWLKISAGHEVDPNKMQALVDSCMERIDALKPGEAALFQGGRPLHIAPFIVKRIGEHNYEIHQYDTTSDECLKVDSREKVEQLIRVVCAYKFQGEGDISAYSKAKEAKQQVFAGSTIKNVRQPQLLNTCHTKGLLTLLCHQITESNAGSRGEEQILWNEFKKKFGEYLLENNLILDPVMKELALKKQEKRSAKYDILQLMYNAEICCEDSPIGKKYRELIAKLEENNDTYGSCDMWPIPERHSYNKNIEFFSSDICPIPERQVGLKGLYADLQNYFKPMPSVEIAKLAGTLSPQLGAIVMRFALMERMNEKDSLQHVKDAIEEVKKNSQKPLEVDIPGFFKYLGESLIKSEAYQSFRTNVLDPLINMSDPEDQPFPSNQSNLDDEFTDSGIVDALGPIAELSSESEEEEEGIDEKTIPHHDWKDLNTTDLQRCMNDLSSEPSLMGELLTKQAVKNVLNQAVEEGLVEPFLAIFESLTSEQQSTLRRAGIFEIPHISYGKILDIPAILKLVKLDLIPTFKRAVLRTVLDLIKNSRLDDLDELYGKCKYVFMSFEIDPYFLSEIEKIDFTDKQIDFTHKVLHEIEFRSLLIKICLDKKDVKPLENLLRSEEYFEELIRQAEKRDDLTDECLSYLNLNEKYLAPESKNMLAEILKRYSERPKI